ncbi:helix-turn-helix domain-containing protein [Bradyrhizobium sp. INPA01-394B]|uniref:Helix-turn-helix domain-containing protein n=1 Tax=Bradyrhizobium campsiandrae TaxID=1729892 RepID=A0ABR7U8X0_9BRAD|nr:helix-turn-helix domain-containing protein [Bradyrhizobium campsiandrae]MBC9878263.1 helix-turn-helix domain-containing protein [Bradyrhizobium campsiandrae]MBC9980514.1 helix-turn-helix domain-containing protein [Bradyrhizobium campsiandrae]
MKLAILALEGCMHSAIAGIADIFALANHVMQQSGAKPRFTCQTLSLDGRNVRAGGGQIVTVDGATSKAGRFDAIVVPGNLVDHATAKRLQPQYDRAGAWLRQQHANGRLIGAFCSGVFLLAGAGLLDNRRATITWWLQGELRERHPTIDLAADAVVTVADRIVCAAGPMSWVDLLLRLIETVESKETARLSADYVVIDTAQRTQSIFMPVGYLLSEDPLLTKADLLVRRTGKSPMTVKRLAKALGLSERTLNRRFRELTNEPPQAFIMRRRVERARTLLETTAQPIKTIARAAGYEDESSFRKAFRKLTLMSPQAYRARRMERAA